MRLRTSAPGGLIFAAALVFLVGLAALYEARHNERQLRWSAHARDMLLRAETCATAQKASAESRLRYLVSRRESDLAERAEQGARARACFQELTAAVADNHAQQTRAQAAAAAGAAAYEAGDRQVVLARARAGDAAGAARLMDATRERDADVAEAVRAFSDAERLLLIERDEARARRSLLVFRLQAAGVLLALLAAGAGVLIVRAEMRARDALDEELRRARRFLETVLENVDASVYVLDLEGRFLFLNRECARVLGGTPETIKGRTLRELVPSEQAEALLANNRRVHAVGAPVELEETVRTADGERVYLARKTALPAGAFPGPAVCGVSADVTSAKTYEKRLEALNKELEAFTYSVSHDLRAPLRSVDGYARILVEDYGSKLDAEGLRLLDQVRDGARRMGCLIDDLLAFSRIGRQELRRSTVDMASLARQAAEESAAAEPGRAVSVAVGAVPPADGDPSLLAQVWRNLLSNGFKYTRGREKARIDVGADVRDGGVEYWVRDDGAGFDPRYAHKLFAVFSRLHGAGEFEGTGVGLALVKRVVERHGGRVSAEGEPGRGATFRFYLPGRDS